VVDVAVAVVVDSGEADVAVMEGEALGVMVDVVDSARAVVDLVTVVETGAAEEEDMAAAAVVDMETGVVGVGVTVDGRPRAAVGAMVDVVVVVVVVVGTAEVDVVVDMEGVGEDGVEATETGAVGVMVLNKLGSHGWVSKAPKA